MPQLIVDVLPYAVGVFASPLPVIVAIVMLFTPRPLATTVTYVLTWVSGLTIVTAVLTLLAGRLEGQQGGGVWGTWVRIVLGLLLVTIALRTWLNRGSSEPPAWLATLMDAGPSEAARYGLLMSAANPKEVLMAIGAALVLGTGDADPAAVAVALLVFVAVGAASVVTPLLVFLAGGEASRQRLTTAREWLQRNSVAVASGVLGVLGVWLLVSGLLKLG